jgi:hypothetical protein
MELVSERVVALSDSQALSKSYVDHEETWTDQYNYMFCRGCKFVTVGLAIETYLWDAR